MQTHLRMGVRVNRSLFASASIQLDNDTADVNMCELNNDGNAQVHISDKNSEILPGVKFLR